MIILSAIAAVIGVSFWMAKKSKDFSVSLWFIPFMLSLGALLLALIFVGITRLQEAENAERYKAFVSTLEKARARGQSGDIERAAMQNSIASWNGKIAAARYWNGTLFDIWHVDAFAELPFIE